MVVVMDAFEIECWVVVVGMVWIIGCMSWYLDCYGILVMWTFSWDCFFDEMWVLKSEVFEFC